VQAVRWENERGGPANCDRVQPLEAALGQKTLGQQGLGQATLARAPADVMSLVIIMPPPPSLPDPMVPTDGFCSLYMQSGRLTVICASSPGRKAALRSETANATGSKLDTAGHSSPAPIPRWVTAQTDFWRPSEPEGNL